MGRDIDSIPFYNKKGELIASYNAYMKMLYWGKKVTEEEKIEILATLEKKKYKNFAIWDSNPAPIPTKPTSKVEEKIETQTDAQEEIKEKQIHVKDESIEKPKRKRRTKAEMEAARAKGEK